MGALPWLMLIYLFLPHLENHVWILVRKTKRKYEENMNLASDVYLNRCPCGDASLQRYRLKRAARSKAHPERIEK